MSRLYLDKEIRHYLVFESGEVQIDEPQNFDSVQLTIERNEDHGFDTTLFPAGLTLDFQNTARNKTQELLESEYFTNGPDANVSYQVRSFDGISETVEFEGKINFNTFTAKRVNAAGFEVSVERTEFIEFMRTRFETLVSSEATETIDGDPSSALVPNVVELHSKELQETSREEQGWLTASLTNAISYFIPGGGSGTRFESGESFLQFGSFQSKPITELELITNIPTAFDATNPTDPVRRPYWIAQEGVSFLEYNIRIKYQLQVNSDITQGEPFARDQLSCGGDGTFDNIVVQTVLEVLDETGASQLFQVLGTYDWASLNPGCNLGVRTPDLDIDHSLDNIGAGFAVNEGWEFYVYSIITVSGDYNRDVLQKRYQFDFIATDSEDSFIELKGLTQDQPSTANLFLPFEVYEKTIRDISGRAGIFRSSLLGRTDSPVIYPEDGCASLLSITNGFQLRQFPLSERPVYFSIADLNQSFSAVHAAGFGFEKEGENDVYVCEKFDHFYQDNEILFINDRISNYTIEFDRDVSYNEVEVGFQKWADEQLNALDEFNTKRIFNSGIQSYKRKIELVSKYLASGYLIEFRRRLRGEQTTDNDFDNDNFFVSLLRDGGGFETERNQNYSSITDVISPSTVYNASISPRQNLMRFIAWLKGVLFYKPSSHEIKFEFGEGNNLASFNPIVSDCLPTDGSFSESDNILLSALENAIFTPELHKFEALLTYGQFTAIKEAHFGIAAEKYGYIRFLNERAEELTGYLKRIEYDPDSLGARLELIKRNE